MQLALLSAYLASRFSFHSSLHPPHLLSLPPSGLLPLSILPLVLTPALLLHHCCALFLMPFFTNPM